MTALFFESCEKTEGTGGTSSIIGRVWVRNYNADFSQINAEYWAEEEDVYIIYGNDTIHSDDTKTSYNGSYRFDYLQKGEYTLFAYSDDSTFTSPSGRVPVKITVTVKDNGEEYLAPMMTILE
jgi:hypothetical protein